ncbi:o-succinylbenzoate--CoA ligase [Pectobacteriaceae bacterium CE70]|nr:o-succinylbenzoate--CoA ligase [Pectobacteriaceae bacterium C52]WJV68116.1 o-succinylbenzoate--CoA ligase [Pectobacteriaceae bacterium CE70]WJY12055.1 o-succinylbenzoate--CoA ligase [Pectobacteriaceae bacterium C80]
MAILNDWPWHVWAGLCPQATALIVEDTDWSWQQLAGYLDDLSANFVQQGVVPGCGVALRGKNSSEMLLCYLACLQCGARLLPLNPQLPNVLTDELLTALNIDFALCLKNQSWPAGIRRLHLTTSVVHQPPSRLEWQSQRFATMTLTSGSSGMPKAAVHHYAAHLASAEGVLQLMPFGPGERWLLSLPLFHVSGQGIVWRWLVAGATLVVRPSRPVPAALWDCTHASLVPTQLWRLLSQDERPQTLKNVLLGGAMIPPSLTQQAEAQGIRCWCGYGLTELASTVCAKRADGRPGVGSVLAAREIRLLNEEILLRGISLASGYWRDGRLIPLTDEDGWFHTRDRGCWEQDEWRILGRLDNQFFSAGEGIQPEDVEAVLLRHPAVEYACVVPVDDEEFGHRPVAVVAVAEEVALESLRDWLSPQLAGFQRPIAYYHLPLELKTGGIKISRQQVKTWVQRQRVSCG